MIFTSECTRNRLSAELRPDLLGKTTALPKSLAGLGGPWEMCAGEGKGKEGRVTKIRGDMVGKKVSEGKEWGNGCTEGK